MIQRRTWRQSRRWLRYGLPVLILTLANSIAAANDFRVYPFLQNPTSEAITITWLTAEATPGTLTVAGVDAFASSPILAQTLAYHPDEIAKHFEGVDPGTPYLHRIRVAGLPPDTQYAYSIDQGDSTFSAEFETAPAGDASIRFIVYADSETEPEHQGRTPRRIKFKTRPPAAFPQRPSPRRMR